jgi:hypothetical protein
MTSARKIKLHLPAKKPRNPLVAAAHRRKAGTHRKSTKATRAAEKAALRKASKL